MAGRYYHVAYIPMDTQQDNGDGGNGASAPFSNIPVLNNGVDLDVNSTAQAGSALTSEVTSSFSNMDLDASHQSGDQYSSGYEDDSESGSEDDDNSDGDSEMEDAVTEGQHAVLSHGAASGNESSDGSETEDESDGDETASTIKEEDLDSSSEFNGTSTAGMSAQHYVLSSQSNAQGSGFGARSSIVGVAAPASPFPTEVELAEAHLMALQHEFSNRDPSASVYYGPEKLPLLTESQFNTLMNAMPLASPTSAGEAALRYLNLIRAGDAASSCGLSGVGQSVNALGSGTTPTANPVMGAVALHHPQANALVGGQQSRAAPKFSFLSTRVPPQVFVCLSHPSITAADVRTILEVHSSRIKLPEYLIPEHLKTCWFSIQHQLNINPPFYKDILRLLDTMTNANSSQGVSNDGALTVNHDDKAQGAQIGGTASKSHVDMASANVIQAGGDNTANAVQGTQGAQGAPVAAGAQPTRQVVAHGARGREVHVSSTAEEAIANLQARAARGDYLYGDGTANHPDAIALANERPLGPLPANPVRVGVRVYNAATATMVDGTGGVQAAAGTSAGAPAGAPGTPGASGSLKRGSQAMTGEYVPPPGMAINGIIPGRITMANAPGLAFGSGVTVAVPPIYIPPMPKVSARPVLVAGDVNYGPEYSAKGRAAASFVPPMTDAAAAAAAPVPPPQAKKNKKRATKATTGSVAANAAPPSNNLFIADPQQGSVEAPTTAATLLRLEQRLNQIDDRMNALSGDFAFQARQLEQLQQPQQVQHHGYEPAHNNGAYPGFRYPDPPAPQ